ncbi:MAG: extracellular solute-binding protein [Betaproteobacteria bacterium]|nr:extracellular solute-binding protein [Betaproteobacteria bacterium]
MLPGIAQAAKYSLKDGKPYAGTKIKIVALTSPQFEGLMLRTQEFKELTGIETEWEFVPFAQLQDRVSAIGENGDASIDVVNYMASWGPPEAYWLLPLDEMLTADGIKMSRYPAAFAEASVYKGSTLGLPMRGHVQIMFRRKDLIPAPPKTWEDLIAISKEIQSKGVIHPLAMYYADDGTLQNVHLWASFLWSAGGEIFDNQMRAAWTSEAGIEATIDYVGLHNIHKITHPASVVFKEQDARNSFQQGESAMLPDWWWAHSSIINPNTSVLAKQQVGVSGAPSYQGKSINSGVSMPFSISDYSKNKDAAWEFLKWVSNPQLEKVNAIERSVDGKSINNHVVTHSANFQDVQVNLANDRLHAAAWDSLEHSRAMPQIPEWPKVGKRISAAIARAAAASGNEADVRIAVREVMTQAAQNVNRLMKGAGYF